MRFARYVIEDIQKNGMQKAEGMFNDFYVNVGRAFDGVFFKDATEDEWTLSEEGFWFWRKAYLSRGNVHVRIKLTREENKDLLDLIDWFEFELKIKNKKTSEERKILESSMQII